MRQKYTYNAKKSTSSFTSINITPLTDITLVLLVVFMIATPIMMQSNVKVNLPQIQSKEKTSESKALVVTIDKKGRLFVNDKKFSIRDFETFMTDYAAKSKDKLVIIDGDKHVRYDIIVNVLDIVRKKGITKVSLGVESK